MQLPGYAQAATSQQPLLIGASPGTTGTMSLYYALKLLNISVVHYTRQFNASTGRESTGRAERKKYACESQDTYARVTR